MENTIKDPNENIKLELEKAFDFNANWGFGNLLSAHLQILSNPLGKHEIQNREDIIFALAKYIGKDERTIRNWINKTSLPSKESIVSKLFEAIDDVYKESGLIISDHQKNKQHAALKQIWLQEKKREAEPGPEPDKDKNKEILNPPSIIQKYKQSIKKISWTTYLKILMTGLVGATVLGYFVSRPAFPFSENSSFLFSDGFEAGIWPLEVQGKLITLDSSISHSGKFSLKMNGDEKEQYLSSEPIVVDPKKNYQLSMWIKSDTPMASDLPVLVKVLQGKLPNDVISWYPRDDETVENLVKTGGQEDWKKYSAPLNHLNPETQLVKIYLRMGPHSAGTAWFDDVVLAEAEVEKNSEKFQCDVLINPFSIFKTGSKSNSEC
jgi:hypothetical protein